MFKQLSLHFLDGIPVNFVKRISRPTMIVKAYLLGDGSGWLWKGSPDLNKFYRYKLTA